MAQLAALMHPTLHGERGSLQRHQWVDYLDTLRDLVLPLELLLARSNLSSCAWKVRLWCPGRTARLDEIELTASNPTTKAQ